MRANGLDFDVLLGGPAGGEPVLLLHGFPQHAGEWSLVTPALWEAGLRTIAPNQRGYSPGARPAGRGSYRMADMTADALSIVDAFGVGPVHVVGHDWGAAVGWHLAARHPDRVRTLTAVSVPHPLALADALAGLTDQRERSAYFVLFRQDGKAEDTLLADDARALRALYAGIPASRVDSYLTPMRERDALTGGLNWYRGTSRVDSEGLGPSRVPTTYVWSDGDFSIGPEAAYGCERYVAADYRFVPLAGVSHWIPDEAPDTVVEAVVSRVGAGG